MGDFNTPGQPSRPSPEAPDFEFSFGVNFVWAEYFTDYQPTDAQFSLADNTLTRPGMDIINPRTKDRVLITHGSEYVVEKKLKNFFSKRRLGATVLSLIDEIPNQSISVDTEEPDAIQIYDIPSGTRLFSPSIKDPSYNEKYIERLCFKLGSIMRQVKNTDQNLFGMTIDSVAVVSGNDDEAEDDTQFAFIPPFNSLDNSPETVDEMLVNFIPANEFPDNFVEAYRNGAGGNNAS